MSQPVKISSIDPNNSYSVIDNGAPGVVITPNVSGDPAVQNSNNWVGVGFDNCANGAVDQGVNAFGNGTIPDCVSTSATKTMGIANSIRYKNPA